MKQQKIDKIFHEIYRRVFKVSTPSLDWDEMINSTDLRNKFDYNNYECDEQIMKDIVENVLKEFKVPKTLRSSFLISFWLGSSPKSK